MKTGVALSMLALAASSAHAALTTHNATYNYLTLVVYDAYASVSERVLYKEDSWLHDTYAALLADVETQLTAAREPYPYYTERLETFFDDAAAYDAQYESLSDESEASELALDVYLSYGAAAPYCDFVFGAVETALSTVKNQTLAHWHRAQRKSIEKSVKSDVEMEALTDQISAYLDVVLANEALAEAFDEAEMDVARRAVEAYDMWPEEEEDDEVEASA